MQIKFQNGRQETRRNGGYGQVGHLRYLEPLSGVEVGGGSGPASAGRRLVKEAFARFFQH